MHAKSFFLYNNLMIHLRVHNNFVIASKCACQVKMIKYKIPDFKILKQVKNDKKSGIFLLEFR